jgi:hypothetical protein
MAVAVGVTIEEGVEVIAICIEAATSQATSKRGAGSGTYRERSASAVSTQKGITKIGALGTRMYRPELMAILAVEM